MTKIVGVLRSASKFVKGKGAVSTSVQLAGLACGVKAGFETGTTVGYLAACAALMFAGHAIDR